MTVRAPHRGHALPWWIALILGMAGILGSLAAEAHGAPVGSLTYQGCFTQSSGCGAGRDGVYGLGDPVGVAASGDGKSVYVASSVSESLARFDRDPSTGALTYQGCFTGTPFCGNSGNSGKAGLDGAVGVAVSGDGKSVYVASSNSDAVTRFTRDTGSGALTYQECFTSGTTCAAANNNKNGLNGAHGIAVSSDGKSVYVASAISNAVVRFDRDTGTGELTYKQCQTQDSGGCGLGNDGKIGLNGAAGVDVSGDGKSVYVASYDSWALTRFDRDTGSGELTYQGCFTQGTGCGAANDNKPGLTKPVGVAVSGDGKSVYVAAQGSDALTRFDRNLGDGAVSYQGCFTGGSGCGAGNDGKPGLDSTFAVDVSGDGKSVYVASEVSNALTRFDRDPGSGGLSYQGCFTQATGCGAGNDNLAGLKRADGVVVTGDGKSVYVAGGLSNALVRFDRSLGEAAASQGTAILPASGPVAVTRALRMSPNSMVPYSGRGDSIARKKRRGARVSYQLDRVVTVVFTVRRETRGRRRGRHCVKPKRSNRRNRRCVRLLRVSGSFKQNGKVGTNSFRFTGRMARKPLRPGRYRLVAKPVGGKATSIPFRVRRP